MIIHILLKEELEKAKKLGEHFAESLETEGFIHNAQIHQVVPVANSYYKNQKDVCMLVIDEKLLVNKLIFEDLDNYGEEYPHVYGSINMDAVVEVIDFPCNSDGMFTLPKQVKKYDDLSMEEKY